MMGALVLLLLGLTSTMRQRLSRPILAAIRAPSVEPEPDRDAMRPPPPPGPGGFDEEALAQFRSRQDEDRRARWDALLHETTSERDAVRAALQARQDELRQRQARLDELTEQLKSQAGQSVTEQATTEMLQERQKQSERELESLSREIALTERKVEELKQSQSAASNAHAILPYDGRSGTARRPIYIECTDKGYRFLPEDVFVGPNELRGATPNANALAFGAKALLRYWTLRNVRDPAHHPRPYLLLIVRPGGVFAYDAARQLLSRLESSFGYELVEDEITLQKLPPDPHAVTLLKDAIALASDTPGERTPTRQAGNPQGTIEEGLSGLPTGDAEVGTGRAERAGVAPPESPGEVQDPPVPGTIPPRPNTVSESESLRTGTPTRPSVAARPRTVRDALPKAKPANLGGRSVDPIDDPPRLMGSDAVTGESAPPRRLSGHPNSASAGSNAGFPAATSPTGTLGQSLEPVGPGAFGSSTSSPEGQAAGTDTGDNGATLEELNGAAGSSSTRRPGARIEVGPERSLTTTPYEPSPQNPAASKVVGRPRDRQTEVDPNVSAQGPRTNERAPIRKPGDGPESAGAAGEMTITPPRGTSAGGAPRNLIALQRKILIRVEADRVWVGEDDPIEIPVKKNQKADQLIVQVTSAMREVTESWGPPPARFYWNPAVRFEVTREGNPVYERLRGAFERQKVKSSIDFVESNPRQGGRRNP
jgi:hypothetical protein